MAADQIDRNQRQWEAHKLADIFPMMVGEPLDELAADIKANGLKEPIDLWQDQIIDGRNRYAACKFAGVTPLFRAMRFPNEDKALAYILSKNLARRHLNHQQRVAVAAKLADMRQGRPKLGASTELTQSKVAEKLDVSVSAIGYHKAVAEKAPELLPAVEAGEITLKAAAQIARRVEPESEFDADVVAPDRATLKARADANALKANKSADRINKRDIRVVFRQLDDAEKRRFLAEVNTINDVLAWLPTVLDSDCRRVPTAAFRAIRSNAEAQS